MKFTLDTNCLIDLEQGRPRAAAVRELLAMAQAGLAEVAVVAISASERQPTEEFSESFAEFQARLATIGLAEVEILMPLGYLDLTYVEWCLVGDDAMEDEVKSIHSTLFPASPYDHPGEDAPLPEQRKWRNRRCDALAIWSHVYHHRDVFVTSDTNFLKHANALGVRVCEPKDACSEAATL